MKSANVLVRAFLTNRFGLGGHRWIKLLIFGWSIVGALGHDVTYPTNDKVEFPSLEPSDIASSARRLCIGRSMGSDPPRVDDLWVEALQQQRAGWVHSPTLSLGKEQLRPGRATGPAAHCVFRPRRAGEAGNVTAFGDPLRTRLSQRSPRSNSYLGATWRKSRLAFRLYVLCSLF